MTCIYDTFTPIPNKKDTADIYPKILIIVGFMLDLYF